MKQKYHVILVALAACLLMGCAAQSQPWASITGKTVETQGAGEEFFFVIPVDQAMLDAQTPLKLYTSGSVRSGTLRVELRDPHGQPIWNPSFAATFNADGVVIPDQTGNYQLGITWNGPLSATLNLSWNSITLTPAILFPGLGMLAVAAAFTLVALRRRAGWKMIWLGAAAWLVTVAVKFLLAAPISPLVNGALYMPGELWTARALAYYLYAGLMTGVTEVLLTWLFLRRTRFGQAAFPQALGFSIGFGAFEAALLGLVSFGSSLTALLAPAQVANVIGSVAQANHLLYGFGPVAERFSIILVHVACNLLLFYSVRRGQSRWFWAAFAFKTLVDAIAGFAQLWGVETAAKLWAIEAILLVFGLVGWWTWHRLELRLRQQSSVPDLPPTAQPVEI